MDAAGSDALAGGFVAFWGVMMCFMYVIPMVIAGLSIAVWIVALVDVVQRLPEEFPNAIAGRMDPNERMMWLLIVLLVGVIGAAVYYFVVMKPYPRQKPVTPGAPPPGDVSSAEAMAQPAADPSADSSDPAAG